MDQPQLATPRPKGLLGVGQHDAIRFDVSWEWEADTRRYWLTHTVLDPSTTERIVHNSTCFKWKDGDGVGDCGLALRWLNEARRYLIAPEPKSTRVR